MRTTFHLFSCCLPYSRPLVGCGVTCFAPYDRRHSLPSAMTDYLPPPTLLPAPARRCAARVTQFCSLCHRTGLPPCRYARTDYLLVCLLVLGPRTTTVGTPQLPRLDVGSGGPNLPSSIRVLYQTRSVSAHASAALYQPHYYQTRPNTRWDTFPFQALKVRHCVLTDTARPNYAHVPCAAALVHPNLNAIQHYQATPRRAAAAGW